MAIDFGCSNCGKVLRVADESAGKQAKCPACGQLSTVPMAPAPPPGMQPTAGGYGAPPAGGVFGAPPQSANFGSGAPPRNPFADMPASAGVNPYQSPPMTNYPVAPSPYGQSPKKIASRVKPPAIAVLVVAILSLLYAVFNISIILVEGIDKIIPPAKTPEERVGQMIGGVVAIVAQFGLNTMGVVGSIQMLRLRGYGMAMAGVICTMINCTVCCIPGIGVGIWALVVLNQPDVRSAFQ